jgi:gamma-glutamyltranspeptidase/glutathione hydrolase
MAKPPVDTSLVDLSPSKLPWPQRIAASRHGVVATQHYRATEAALEIFDAGGNAIDAAAAAAFALGVCEPAASGLGGQTMAIVHSADLGRTIALDGSSRAPNRATPGALGAPERLRGHCATTVPSTPATLAYLVTHLGTLPLARVLEPAARLAEEGVSVTELLHRLSRREQKHLQGRSAAAVFLRDGARAHPVGATLTQPALAATLRRLAKAGVEDFYTGRIARAVAADMQRNGGLLHADDLAQVPWPVERKPVAARVGANRYLTMPPPGSGRTLLQMLLLAEQLPFDRWGPDTPRGAAMLVDVIRRANLDRRDRPFDPTFYAQVPERKMLSEEYARDAAREIRKRVKSSGETTHLSTMDRKGNAVALTQSIERVFGSCELSPDVGFLYNNYMSAFEYEDITHPYYLRPNAVPWASVAPTVAVRRSRPVLAIGSPGSERIASSVLQVLLRLVGQSPYDAVAAPRLHCSIAGRVSLEASRTRDDIPPLLERRGFTIDAREPFSFYLGCVQLAVRDGSELVAVADPRRDGAAAGVHP